MRVLVFAVSLCFAASVQAQESGNRLNLICGGQGAANKTTTSNVRAWGNDGSQAGATVNSTQSVNFGGEVALWIEGTDGRIRVPEAMLPKIRGGEKGWFRLKSIIVTENEITASVVVNFLNSPKLRLDRMSGAISLSGSAGDFGGNCLKFDPDAVERKF